MLIGLMLACTGETTDSAATTGDDTGEDTRFSDVLPEDFDCDALSWHDGSLTLSTQSALTAFCDTANAVAGDLTLITDDTTDPITELDGLACLCEVDGSLVLTAEPPASPPPPHVTGDIELPRLARIGGDLHLINQLQLTSVVELWSLAEIGGDVIITGSPELAEIGLYTLEALGGSVQTAGLPALTFLRLPGITAAGSISLGAPAMPYLVEINLDALAALSGDLSLTGAGNLARLPAPKLTAIGGHLQLQANCGVSPELPLLESVGSLTLSGNCALSDLSGLASLRRITGESTDGSSIFIADNPELSEAVLTDFLASLTETGTGTLTADPGGDCQDLITQHTGSPDFCL